jgi:hypothetical protein
MAPKTKVGRPANFERPLLAPSSREGGATMRTLAMTCLQRSQCRLRFPVGRSFKKVEPTLAVRPIFQRRLSRSVAGRHSATHNATKSYKYI